MFKSAELFVVPMALVLSSSAAQATPVHATISEVKECAIQAEKQFEQYKKLGLNNSALMDYNNHYNKKMDRCLLRIYSLMGNVSQTFLEDAYEGRIYASYLWVLQPGTKYQDNPPKDCWVSVGELSRMEGSEFSDLIPEKKLCSSSEEFESLTDSFMHE